MLAVEKGGILVCVDLWLLRQSCGKVVVVCRGLFDTVEDIADLERSWFLNRAFEVELFKARCLS